METKTGKTAPFAVFLFVFLVVDVKRQNFVGQESWNLVGLESERMGVVSSRRQRRACLVEAKGPVRRIIEPETECL